MASGGKCHDPKTSREAHVSDHVMRCVVGLYYRYNGKDLDADGWVGRHTPSEIAGSITAENLFVSIHTGEELGLLVGMDRAADLMREREALLVGPLVESPDEVNVYADDFPYSDADLYFMFGKDRADTILARRALVVFERIVGELPAQRALAVSNRFFSQGGRKIDFQMIDDRKLEEVREEFASQLRIIGFPLVTLYHLDLIRWILKSRSEAESLLAGPVTRMYAAIQEVVYPAKLPVYKSPPSHAVLRDMTKMISDNCEKFAQPENAKILQFVVGHRAAREIVRTEGRYGCGPSE